MTTVSNIQVLPQLRSCWIPAELSAHGVIPVRKAGGNEFEGRWLLLLLLDLRQHME
jgi:hypothetical protein